MICILSVPVHNPLQAGSVADKSATWTLAELEAAYAECARNLSRAQLEQIETGQVSSRLMVTSPLLAQAVALHAAIVVQKKPFRTTRR